MLFVAISGVSSAQSVPDYFVYEGRLLDNSKNPITASHDFRFSFWQVSDFVAGDVMGDGSINAGAGNYGGWQEVHSVIPNNDGFFSIELGQSA